METGKTAIFAGNDELSRLAVRRLGRAGNLVVLSQAPLSYRVDTSYLIEAGNLAQVVGIFQTEQVRRIALVGRFDHAAILAGSTPESGREFLAGMPDWRGENLLLKLAEFLRAQGVEVIPLPEIFGPELAERVLLTSRGPDELQQRDIQYGAEAVRALMPYRIGQALAVKQGVILAVEGIEGTDRMIERTGRLCRDFTVVKMAGLDKDERFDLPAVGVRTLRTLHRAGGRVLAVEAGRTLIVNKKKVVELCDECGITLLGI